MCLGGLSKYYTEDNRKDTGLYGNVLWTIVLLQMIKYMILMLI